MAENQFFTTDIDVRFRDIDAMGHVNNAVFFTYFEQGRLQFFFSDVPEDTLPEFNFILAHISCDYLQPVMLENKLAVQIRVGKIGGKSFTFQYKLVDRSDVSKVYATGESVQVCYDYETQTTIPIPRDLMEKISTYLL
jgi:acyl-CoA thioester hydrolase